MPVVNVAVFEQLYCRGTMLHSTCYGREGGKRDSTICSFLLDRKENFGILQKFVICCNHRPLALITPFNKADKTLLQSIGRPGRETLEDHCEIDSLSAFIVQVSKTPSSLCAVPITNLLVKCIRVTMVSSPHDYIIKLPNNFEHQ